MQIYRRTISERIVHALAFEILAIFISAPAAAWITGHSIWSMGIITAVIAFIAVVWNMIYNWLFDKLQSITHFDRSYLIRIAHACFFEIGLIFIAIPFIAWWLNIGIWQALILDIGFVLFYLPYGFFFNLGYDKIRQRIIVTN